MPRVRGVCRWARAAVGTQSSEQGPAGEASVAGAGRLRAREQTIGETPEQDAVDDVASRVGRMPNAGEVPLPDDVRFGVPNADGCCPRGVSVVLQEKVTDVDVDEVRRSCGCDCAKGCSKDILKELS